jgi:DNA-binding transcriptional LysR family regulator
MADIELRELTLFMVLAEELHFGRTAERLGLTTSRATAVAARRGRAASACRSRTH